MVPTKTERFEMRLDPALVERVDNWRSGQDDVPSRAEAVRRLIEQALGGGTTTQFQPTQSEKVMMWMLAQLLKRVDPEEQGTAELVQEAIYGGHYWALEWELTGILHNHVDRRDAVTLVVNTLDAWNFVERAYEGFSDAEKERIEKEVGPWGKNPMFPGFDGNNETEHMAIARFLVEKLGRFERFKGRSFNSHMPVIGRYRRMTAAFEPIRARLVRRELSPDEVIELLKRE